jgi:hypothetical protein
MTPATKNLGNSQESESYKCWKLFVAVEKAIHYGSEAREIFFLRASCKFQLFDWFA